MRTWTWSVGCGFELQAENEEHMKMMLGLLKLIVMLWKEVLEWSVGGHVFEEHQRRFEEFQNLDDGAACFQ